MMGRPTQAVILCGGLGTRLRPLTDTLPKPMAPVNQRPFLEYLIEQVRDLGLDRILLLTGYRGESIREHFRDGSHLGVKLSYSHGPTTWETGRRIREAVASLDERFLLLYSDNFVPFNLGKSVAAHGDTGKAVTLLLQRKENGNVRLTPGGEIDLYDPTRSAPGLDHVEIGYMIVDRDPVLAAFDSPDVSFSRILVRLAANGQVGARVTCDPYHSISDLERLRLAERYLRIKRIVLIDRDGTINERPPRAEYVTEWARFRWVPETVEAMRRLAAAGFRFIVLSNQAGIARGSLDAASVEQINRRMVAELAASGIDVLDVYVCPHHWDDGCYCRKPQPGMFFRASREHLLRMDRTVYVGDDPRDALAAHNAECLSILVGPDRNADPGGGARPALTAATMLDAVPWIMSSFERWETGGVSPVQDSTPSQLPT